MLDLTLMDHLAAAYAADSFFADEVQTAELFFTQGLWWKGDRIVAPKSDTKRLIFQTCHGHLLAGHLGVTKSLKAINSRVYWVHA